MYCLQGVGAFWVASPVDNSVDVDLHWADEFGNTLIYRAGDTRCVLIDSHPGVAGSMFASVQPCHARKADGVVCEAATTFRKSFNSNHSVCLHEASANVCCVLQRRRPRSASPLRTPTTARPRRRRRRW